MPTAAPKSASVFVSKSAPARAPKPEPMTAHVTAYVPDDGPPLPADELCAYLWTKYRVKRSPRRLAQLRIEGGGPPFVRDGCVVRYPLRLADAWVAELYGEPVRSTTEESARRIAARAEQSCSAKELSSAK